MNATPDLRDAACQVILDSLPLISIQSPSFRRRMVRFLGSKTLHFIHELNNFARSPYDMYGYDRAVRYSPRIQMEDVIAEYSLSDSSANNEDLTAGERSLQEQQQRQQRRQFHQRHHHHHHHLVPLLNIVPTAAAASAATAASSSTTSTTSTSMSSSNLPFSSARESPLSPSPISVQSSSSSSGSSMQPIMPPSSTTNHIVQLIPPVRPLEEYVGNTHITISNGKFLLLVNLFDRN